MGVNVYRQYCPIMFGRGALNQLGETAKGFGMTKVMIITDEGMAALGIPDRALKSLKDAGLEGKIWAQAGSEAPESALRAGAEAAREYQPDGLVGIGGGSSLDCTKCVSVLANNDVNEILGDVAKYLVAFKTGTPIEQVYPKPFIRSIIIPTTAGTGSESTPLAVINDVHTDQKIALPSAPIFGIIDPELAVGSPARLTSWCGLDALAHDCECLMTKMTNKHNELLALESIRLIFKWLPVACRDTGNYEAREELAWAANLAGLAFAETDCNVGHSVAQSLGHVFHIPHGLACGSVTPGYLEFAAKDHPGTVRRIGLAMGLDCAGVSDDEIGKVVADRDRQLMKELDVVTLTDFNGTKLEDALTPIADAFESSADPLAAWYDGEFTRGDIEKIITGMFTWKD